MKTIRFTAFSILFSLLVLTSACKKETNPAAAIQGGSKILVTGQDAGIGLKSTLSGQSTVWIQTSDKVGIYSDLARTASGGVGNGSVIVNAPFTADHSTASSTFSGTMYWGTASSTHHFYAYYPWVTGPAASNAVPVSLLTPQTQSAANNSDHIGDLDFMVATPVTVTSPANTEAVGSAVNLNYNHLFTILEFQIKGSVPLAKVSLSGSNTLAFSGGTINLNQTPATGVAYTFASQSGTTKEAVVTLTTPATLTATATSVYMVINPGTQAGNCLIGISTNGTTWKYISKMALGGGFLRGNKYVVTVNADDALLENVVVGGAGKIWMDRNLGATQVATSRSDEAAYGDLYQWGRGSDGHQSRTSSLYNTTLAADATSTPSTAWYGRFITNSSSPSDWLTTQNGNLWQGLSGENNPCPTGYRIPTDAELTAEIATWSELTSVGAFGSPLKFTVAGGRDNGGGSLYNVGSSGYYWSSSVDGTNSRNLSFVSSNASMNSNNRALGFSVRCIKE